MFFIRHIKARLLAHIIIDISVNPFYLAAQFGKQGALSHIAGHLRIQGLPYDFVKHLKIRVFAGKEGIIVTKEQNYELAGTVQSDQRFYRFRNFPERRLSNRL